MSSEKHSKRDGKKEKSTNGEKKRKRDHKEDGERTKSKKHRSLKQAQQPEVPSSPFHVQSASLYLPLAPVSQGFPLEGLCAEHLSPLLLTFYPPLGGVVLSYNNVRLSERPQGEDESTDLLLQNIDEYAVSYCWVTATFLLFKPTPGVELEGYVNLQNQGHLGVVCWNLFNASIEAKRLPKEWKWVDVSEMETEEDAAENGNGGHAEDGMGYWVDGEGKKLEGQIKFRVKQIESSHDRERGFLSIEGTMLEMEEERELAATENEERAQNQNQATKKKHPLRGHRFAATDLSIPREPEDEEASASRRDRHRY